MNTKKLPGILLDGFSELTRVYAESNCHTRLGRFPKRLVGDFPSLATLSAMRTDTLSTSC